MVSGTTAGGTIDRTAGPKICAIYQIRGLSVFRFLFFLFADLRLCDPLGAGDEARTEIEGVNTE